MTVSLFHMGFGEKVGLQQAFKEEEGDRRDGGASSGRMLC